MSPRFATTEAQCLLFLIDIVGSLAKYITLSSKILPSTAWKSLIFSNVDKGATMFAIVKAGAHQYRVSQGDEVTIDFVAGNVGDKITLNEVLLVKSGDLKIGQPTVKGASVEAVIKQQTRNPKVTVFKYRRTKNSKVTRGHKQPVTVIEVSQIKA
jgi:large subunit ribosomal protein L21